MAVSCSVSLSYAVDECAVEVCYIHVMRISGEELWFNIVEFARTCSWLLIFIFFSSFLCE